MNHRLAPTLLVVAAIVLASPAAAQSTKAKPPEESEKKTTPQVGGGSADALDRRLLENLDELQGGRDGKRPELPQGTAARPNVLTEGEDVGARGPLPPLVRIGQQMLAAEKRMAAKDSSGETERLQSQILADLDELIDQARRGGGSGRTSRQSPRSGQKDAQQTGTEPGRQDGPPSPARDDRRKGRNPSSAGPDSLQNVVDKVWGHLPDRLRRGVLNPSAEQFLPKYETLIERYYRRLAEDEETQP